MPERISDLTEQTVAPASDDWIPIVDVSDTSQAATGTTKKITVQNLLDALGAMLLESAD